MAVSEQYICDQYALYNGDCIEVLGTMPDDSIHHAIYSPPFSDLFSYSSSDRDLSNCRDYGQFLEHYEYVVTQMARVTMPGRINAVHCMDIPIRGQKEGYDDFPGDIIRIHKRHGFYYCGRICIWKEPFRVALRTRLISLTHRQIARDSTLCSVAGGDFLLLFRRAGQNPIPVAHPVGLTDYAGDREIPPELIRFRGETRQQKNKLSQWIWRQYASNFWDDIRVDRVLPYKQAREPDDERHVCPLQLDVIERSLTLFSNEGEKVLTPFCGVGSEVYGAVKHGRRGIGIELKPSYFKQSLRNVKLALSSAAQPSFEFSEAADDVGVEAEQGVA